MPIRAKPNRQPALLRFGGPKEDSREKRGKHAKIQEPQRRISHLADSPLLGKTADLLPLLTFFATTAFPNASDICLRSQT